MKSEAEQAMSINTAQVWAEEVATHAATSKPPGMKTLMTIAALAAALAIALSVGTYVSGLKELHALAAQNADNKSVAGRAISELAEQADRWGLYLLLAAAGSGVGAVGAGSAGAADGVVESLATGCVAGSAESPGWLARLPAAGLEEPLLEVASDAVVVASAVAAWALTRLCPSDHELGGPPR